MRRVAWAMAGGAVAAVLAGSVAAAAGPALTWSTFVTPIRGAELAGLWAGSASDVWAVGLQPGGACQYRTLTEHWDGSAWAAVPSPSKLTVNSTLAAASGTAVNDVWAVGETGCPSVQSGQTLALHWNGSAWSVVKTPNPGFFPVLHAVSARTQADAWAVGDTTVSGTDDPLIEHWDGHAWRVSTVPSAIHGPLSGVAAVSASDAWAVGSQSFSNRYGPLALRWNGTRWSPVPVPIPAGTNAFLDSVVALPNGQAVAVGAWRPTPSTSKVLVEEWDGKAWHMVTVPPIPGFSALYSVAAAPGQGPWASGFSVSATTGSAVFLQRVGTSWQLVNPPPVNQGFAVAGASDGEVWTSYFQFIAHGTPG